MLQRAESELRRTGDPQDVKLANELVARIKKRGDFPLSEGMTAITAEKPPLGLLEQAVTELKEKPHTPELVNRFWQIFLETSIKSQELDIPVPIVSCDRTQRELKALKKEGRMWIPEAGLTYAQLDEIFPKMGSYAVREGSTIKDEYRQDAKGVDVEVDIDAPKMNTTQKDLENLFKKQRRNGMRLSTYILASQASKLLTNQYLDEGGTMSRLLGSRYEGPAVHADFRVNGRLRVYLSLERQRHDPYLGGRSEGVKKA